MPKLVVSLFSGCGGLDLGFTGGFAFQGRIPIVFSSYSEPLPERSS